MNMLFYYHFFILKNILIQLFILALNLCIGKASKNSWATIKLNSLLLILQQSLLLSNVNKIQLSLYITSAAEQNSCIKIITRGIHSVESLNTVVSLIVDNNIWVLPTFRVCTWLCLQLKIVTKQWVSFIDNTVVLKKQILKVNIYVKKKLTTKINILLNYRNIKETRISKSSEHFVIYINIFMCYGKTRSPLFTTCTVDMSFSTLKRVKTWTRSTKEEYRLDGLCMLSVHRQKVQNDTKFIEKLVKANFMSVIITPVPGPSSIKFKGDGHPAFSQMLNNHSITIYKYIKLKHKII
ncbi:zinc finger MYM-type protein 1-like [Aphis craccivora]|uniref:Zinc finger MYM-type protein 1-like n=1 Tax=Aphis craccivora TaxID=307492 RepID=A0A6G0ZMB5_APHCR|nr:zinc finger MYM-type protein 1-like [Aphis craccivora]